MRDSLSGQDHLGHIGDFPSLVHGHAAVQAVFRCHICSVAHLDQRIRPRSPLNLRLAGRSRS